MHDKAHKTLVSRIQARCAELGLSIHAASERTGSPSLIPNIVYGRSKSPRIETLDRVARALETTSAYLTGLTDNPQTGTKTEIVDAGIKAPTRGELQENLPVMGTAAGSVLRAENGEDFVGFELESRVVQYVRRPKVLANIPEAYSIFVDGDSMYPMHSPGDLRFVNPLLPVGPGDTVIVQTRTWQDHPGQAYIKLYRRRASGFLVLEQLNPAATIAIPQQYVSAVHKVLTMNDLFEI